MSRTIDTFNLSTTPNTGSWVAMSTNGLTVRTSMLEFQKFSLGHTGMEKTVSGSLNIYGHEFITGNLDVSGVSKLGKDSTSITNVIGNLRISGAEYISGSLTVTGAFSATGRVDLGLNGNSIVNISGKTTLAGTGIVYGPFTTYGPAIISGRMTVSGSGTFGVDNTSQHTFNGKTIFSNAAQFNQSINVTSDITGGGAALFAGRGDFLGQLGVSGDVNLGDASSDVLTIRAKQVNTSDIHANTNLNVGQTCNITGALTTYGANTFGDSIVDTSTFNGKIIGNNGIQVTGAHISFSGTSKFSGDIHSQGTLICYGNVGITNNLLVSGKTVLGNDSNDQTHIYSDVFVGRHETISGNLNVSGTFTTAGAITGPYNKKIKFNPSLRLGTQSNVGGGGSIYYQGAGTPAPGGEGSFFSNVVVMQLPSQWHPDNLNNYASGDYIYITGIKGGANNRDEDMSRSYKGVKRLIFASSTGLKFDIGSTPGLSDDGGATGVVPFRHMILASWKPSQAYGVTGVIPFITPTTDAPSNWVVHWKILYDKPFSNNNYLVFMTPKQRGATDTFYSLGRFMVIPGISSGDAGLTTETIITMDTHDIRVNASNNDAAVAGWFPASTSQGDEHPIIPREFHFKAEEF